MPRTSERGGPQTRARIREVANRLAVANGYPQALSGRDADAKRLDAVVAKLRPQLQGCETKNAQLYKLGEEVLDLYDKQDIFDLASREPVTKLKRVEIENAMQDYEDKMRDSKIGQQ